MLNNQRHKQILSILDGQTSVTVQELARILYASPSTIRRDLARLETEGYLKRIHGGAIKTNGDSSEEPSALRRTQRHAEKRLIVEKAKRFLSDSTSYFFDSSSTCALLALELGSFVDVKIATNSQTILANMASSPNLTLISTGGYLRSPYNELTGNLTRQAIASMNADIFFLTCTGLSLEQGTTENADENVAVKQAFYRNAQKRILLADHTKFGKNFFYHSFDLEDFDYIVTDKKPEDPAFLERLGEKIIF